ncbi:nuclear transport factor 2 family protein [Mesorhizobium sp. M1340]|uniref:nuclear transport factor 2 family protein n=1 Tax=unclassified Mesorhizobium TaxID=325217 RepID=UPI0033373CF5
MKAVAPNVHHRVSGAHALGGERHDKEALRRWFERLGRVLPNLHLTVNHIWVKGWPWHTTVFAQWDGTATFTLRWGRVHALEEFYDSQAAARGLAAQATAGLRRSCRRTDYKLAAAQ